MNNIRPEAVQKAIEWMNTTWRESEHSRKAILDYIHQLEIPAVPQVAIDAARKFEENIGVIGDEHEVKALASAFEAYAARTEEMGETDANTVGQRFVDFMDTHIEAECFDGSELKEYWTHLRKITLAQSPLPADGWRTIESAPKDGRDILVYNPHNIEAMRILIKKADGGFWEWMRKDGATNTYTHWQPLPAAPKG